MNDNLHDVLFDGEELLWEGKPKKLCFVLRSFGKLLPASILFLIFVSFFIGVMATTEEMAQVRPFLIVFFSLHLLPVWKCIGKLISSNLEYKNVIYAMTNRRIVLRSGVVGLDFDGADYSDISHVRVDVSPLERMFGVGTLMVTTTSGRVFLLSAIPDPYETYKRINKVLIDMKADVNFPNAYRPETNPGYHTKYRD